jgi:hypothetical protein
MVLIALGYIGVSKLSDALKTWVYCMGQFHKILKILAISKCAVLEMLFSALYVRFTSEVSYQ